MPAKLTLHPPQRASRFLVIRDGETLTIGRDPDCELVLEDGRVSKRHARLRWSGSGWVLDDLGSKNGTSVNGLPAQGAELRDGDWVSFGGLMGRFDAISEAEAQALHEERLARLQTSLALRRRLGADLDPLDLLLRFLESAVQVVGAERGFVLVVGSDGALRAEVAAGFDAGQVEDNGFDGSVGAVARALESREPVIVADAQSEPWLAGRPSIVRKGLGALACVPLVHEGRLLGLLYVDSRRPGAAVSELDLEILASLAEHASVVLASARLDRRIKNLLKRPLAGSEASVLAALTRRVGLLGQKSAPKAGGSSG